MKKTSYLICSRCLLKINSSTLSLSLICITANSFPRTLNLRMMDSTLDFAKESKGKLPLTKVISALVQLESLTNTKNKQKINKQSNKRVP